MARRIEHRAEYGFPAELVYAALIDETYLRQRLARIGGRRSELVSHTVADEAVEAVMRQAIDPEHLPSVVKRITPNGVVIVRTESWRWDTQYRGRIAAAVDGMPGTFDGTMSLVDTAAGSAISLGATVSVSIPLVGGKIESAIADQLRQLLEAEARFTTSWLQQQS